MKSATKILSGLMVTALILPAAAGTASAATYHSDSDTSLGLLDYLENEHRAARAQKPNPEKEQLKADTEEMSKHLRYPIDPTKAAPVAFEGDDLMWNQVTGDFTAKGKVKVTQLDEHRFEGDRSARMRLDKAPWTSGEKLWRKGLKQLTWISVALWTGFSFVGFFVPIRQLGAELLALHGSWQLFWIGLYSLATYGFAGYMREQVCKYMCPYARFQSAMFDEDTLIVTYDSARGEPRGVRSKKVDPKAAGLGDCIDCSLCVQVCPTGIDIRNGLQYECIGCGLCVDACNTVMDKVGYPRGLIRFATQSGMRQRWTNHQMLRRVFRPRVLGYGAVLLTLAVAMMVSLVTRTPLKVDVVRDRTAIARIVPGGKLENVYQLQIMNATETPQHYRISAQGLEGLTLAPDSTVQVPATGARWVSVQLQIPYGSAAPGSHPIHFTVQALEHPAQVQEKATFLVPR